MYIAVPRRVAKSLAQSLRRYGGRLLGQLTKWSWAAVHPRMDESGDFLGKTKVTRRFSSQQ